LLQVAQYWRGHAEMRQPNGASNADVPNRIFSFVAARLLNMGGGAATRSIHLVLTEGGDESISDTPLTLDVAGNVVVSEPRSIQIATPEQSPMMTHPTILNQVRSQTAARAMAGTRAEDARHRFQRKNSSTFEALSAYVWSLHCLYPGHSDEAGRFGRCPECVSIGICSALHNNLPACRRK
jgi:hypothetical protein